MTHLVWNERRLGEDKHRRNDHRSPYQRDRARILHSAAFRRLQAKTQVLGVGMNDFYRTRLTHSLEVSQIGTGITAQLKQKQPQFSHLIDSMSLIESLCLAHDIGHPPFGHGGEVALNYMMRSHGGFEGNGQTFRILTRLEPYTEHYGMNLCRRTLLGILKYPAPHSQLCSIELATEVGDFRQLKPSKWPPVKGIFDDDVEILDWVLAPLTDQDRQQFLSSHITNDFKHKRTRYKSLDCSIMELADDIAYAVHDLEDAIVMGIVSEQQWLCDVSKPLCNSPDAWLKKEFATISQRLFSSKHHERKDAIGTLVNGFVTAISITEAAGFDEPLLKYNAALESAFADALNILKQFVYKYVIRKPEIQMLEYKGQQIVMELFEAFISDPERLLPVNTQERWIASERLGENSHRVIADYISGMTDGFAARLHQHLFSAKSHSMMDFNSDF
ncbi:deoxyguanosinetriphosphate triphosphohydrolase family protein [Shewanella schlegeliana]|uniref:Deoxyguanosinetriphosphate triphosphohydrolase-like protein n=1 Tax=Shewanella schlegeliana TaxID=190308 RepID=A0ABS1SZA9_9GAMM|nr:anti-phage deoxyguanosine triphosphatase [Shewanella schlegeliana]MBL4913868.1 deoxyguanosinetriphosphate triphosphohydrolase family protein [Shewanella schlegeliana]MCL1108748.1 deoxyguanosinetriphosphate triphosphohydrolase family protein [Shewanella schlegeliana]GIU26203.1 deoxyguanosinetriphosphate triphosphohydrolase-like protein [Shewanella schlegeliana]